MNMMMISGGYDMPSFKIWGATVKDPPEDAFEMTIKAKITKQEMPVHGEPCVEITIIEVMDSDGVKIEEADEKDSKDVGDELEDAMTSAAMKKSGEYEEGEED